jgi:hypothetical protein
MVLRFLIVVPAVVALYMPSCRTPVVRPTSPTEGIRMAQLWEQPTDLPTRDLYAGGWGASFAPDRTATFRFVERTLTGTNPGMTVRDPEDRKWSVKQAHPDRAPEGPIEVTLSRILEAVGYHQPPVYFLQSFKLAGLGDTHVEPGGRFRLDTPNLKTIGEWSWQENPFVGTRPYQGLLVILLVFNSSDLKNANNILYQYRAADGTGHTWYVVRDLGMALGETGRLEPRRGDVAVFERTGFITGVEGGFVRFDYHGFHQELVTNRVTPADVRWASELLSGLTIDQWRDAFRAGGFAPEVAERYIRCVLARISQGRALGEAVGGA